MSHDLAYSIHPERGEVARGPYRAPLVSWAWVVTHDAEVVAEGAGEATYSDAVRAATSAMVAYRRGGER